MRVLRVEAKFSVLDHGYRYTNVGPYCYRDIIKGCGYKPLDPTDLYDEDINPEPHDDGLVVHYSYIFGFKDTKQLIDWFHYNCVMLHESGYIVAEYEIPEDKILFGTKQIAFPKGCELLAFHNLAVFFHKNKKLLLV